MSATILSLTAFRARSGVSNTGNSHERGNGGERWGQKVSLTLSTDGHQFDSLAADEVQGFVHVGDLVETHLAFVGFGKSFT